MHDGLAALSVSQKANSLKDAERMYALPHGMLPRWKSANYYSSRRTAQLKLNRRVGRAPFVVKKTVGLCF